MRIACLIIGYRGAPVLARMLPVLLAAEFDLFLHLDAKIDKEDYLRVLGTPGRDCRILSERIDIFWGGYSMMLVALKLLETARDAGPYDRYVLISDDAFPILPANEIAARLSVGNDLITMVKQPKENQYHNRYTQFFFYDHRATMVRGGIGSRLPEIDEAFERRIAEIAVLRRIGKKTIDVYFGSQFWGLTGPSADFLLETVQADLHLVKSFEYTALPDEIMVQSILGNRLSKDCSTGPVFEDFPLAGGPTVFSAVEQLPHLHDRYVFLRKIDPNAIALIDTMADRLARGLTIFGNLPGLPHFETPILDEQGNTLINLRLSAPVDDGEEWHAIEHYLDRAFRWTATNRVEWRFRLRTTSPATLSFFVPLVIEDRPHIFENSYLRVNNSSQKMTHGAGGLNATVKYDGGEHLIVTLVTPPPISPRDIDPRSTDDRMIGLSVAL